MIGYDIVGITSAVITTANLQAYIESRSCNIIRKQEMCKTYYMGYAQLGPLIMRPSLLVLRIRPSVRLSLSSAGFYSSKTKGA